MRKRIPPRPAWPPRLAGYRLDDWSAEQWPHAAWARTRARYAAEHPELGEDPVELLAIARTVRLAELAAARR